MKSMARYESEYKVNTILLRDEMLSRLPKSFRSEKARFIYALPTNMIGVRSVVDHLEKLAKRVVELREE